MCDALESFYFEKTTEEFNIASDWIIVSELGWHITCEEVNQKYRNHWENNCFSPNILISSNITVQLFACCFISLFYSFIFHISVCTAAPGKRGRCTKQTFKVFTSYDCDCIKTLGPSFFRSVAFSSGYWSTGATPQIWNMKKYVFLNPGSRPDFKCVLIIKFREQPALIYRNISAHRFPSASYSFPIWVLVS